MKIVKTNKVESVHIKIVSFMVGNSDSSGKLDDKNMSVNENLNKITVNVIDNWSVKKTSKPSLTSIIQTPVETEKSRRLKSFNNYLDETQNEYLISIPDKIEGTYKYDFNIMEIHNQIVNKFHYEKEHKIKQLEHTLKMEETKINRRQNMVERKNSIKVINNIRKEMEDILSNKSFNEYIHKINPLLDAYNLLGSLSKIVSFAKIRRSDDNTEDVVPEDSISQERRHQLILDFIEIARRYIQIDLIREIKEGNNCPVCGNKLDDTMSNIDDDGISICSDCGIERISVVKTRFYQDNSRTNNSGNNYEDQANFKKGLMRYQGKQPDKPPVELYERLTEYFTENEIPKINIGNDIIKFVTPKDIKLLPLNEEGEKDGTSRSLMYKALKDIDNTDYYDDINIILNEMWGWSLPDVSHLEDGIMEDYYISQRVYEVLPKDRKSSLNSQFRLFKQLKRRKHPCKAKDFRIPTTYDILEFHNTMWNRICEALNWENL